MVIWITGLSGAGKSSLCEALRARLKPRLPELVILDGDAIRRLYGDALGFSEEERKTQIQRLQGWARMLSDQGLLVLVAALYAHDDLLAWNRENFDAYFEIYLDAPLALVRARDAKGLYAEAERGATANVVGVDIPWHAPRQPDLRLDAGDDASSDQQAESVIRAVPRLAAMITATGT